MKSTASGAVPSELTILIVLLFPWLREADTDTVSQPVLLDEMLVLRVTLLTTTAMLCFVPLVEWTLNSIVLVAFAEEATAVQLR